MSEHDDWLRNKARETNRQQAEARETQQTREENARRSRQLFDSQIADLWGALGRELRRQAAVYNEEIGDANGLYVEIHPDMLDIRANPGNQVVLRLNREQMRVEATWSIYGSAGKDASRPSLPIIVTDDVSFGRPVEDVVGSILRKVLD